MCYICYIYIYILYTFIQPVGLYKYMDQYIYINRNIAIGINAVSRWSVHDPAGYSSRPTCVMATIYSGSVKCSTQLYAEGNDWSSDLIEEEAYPMHPSISRSCQNSGNDELTAVTHTLSPSSSDTVCSADIFWHQKHIYLSLCL